jgi:hypothetical protein
MENRYDKITNSIKLLVTVYENSKHLELGYKCNGEDYYYKVQLISLTSNLDKRFVLYFRCPFTHKRFRNSHLIKGRFIHGSTLTRGVYSKQTQSESWRLIEKVYGSYFNSNKYYHHLQEKYFKEYYQEKPIKRYLKLIHTSAKAKILITEILMTFGY